VLVAGTLGRSAWTLPNANAEFSGETDVALDGAGNLVITDIVLGGKDDLLDISISGTNLRVHDPNHTLVSHPGETLVDIHTVDVPRASITGNIQVNTLNGTDSFTVDSVNGNPIVAGGAIFNGGNGTDTIGSSGNADYGLTDTKLTVGNRTVTLIAVEAADLKGGAASNTFTVSNWTLTAKLDGQEGGDVYIINFKGSGAGSVAINDTGASGTDKGNLQWRNRGRQLRHHQGHCQARQRDSNLPTAISRKSLLTARMAMTRSRSTMLPD